MFENDKIILSILNISDVYREIDKYSRIYKVVGIITNVSDDFKKNYSRCSVPIYDYSMVNSFTEKIIVLDDNWDNRTRYTFAKILFDAGLNLGVNFIFESMQKGKIDTNMVFELVNKDKHKFHELILKIFDGKKLVMVHGNCQTHVISSMLATNMEFNKKYITCEMPIIWEGGKGEAGKLERLRLELMAESGIFRLTDIFFTQDVSKDNRFWYKFSTEYLITLLRKDCTVITISNLFFMGYFPQYKKLKNPSGVNFFRGKILDSTEYMDINILQMIINDKSDDEIIKEITSPKYYHKEDLITSTKKELELFKNREQNIDIKMHDYLEKNWKNYLLFATSNHPTRKVMIEFSIRILNKLGIYKTEINCSGDEIQEPMPSDWRYLIYPSVLNELGINRELEYTFKAILSQEELKVIPDHILIPGESLSMMQNNLYLVNIKGDFETYMKIYVRCVRAALMML